MLQLDRLINLVTGVGDPLREMMEILMSQLEISNKAVIKSIIKVTSPTVRPLQLERQLMAIFTSSTIRNHVYRRTWCP